MFILNNLVAIFWLWNFPFQSLVQVIIGSLNNFRGALLFFDSEVLFLICRLKGNRFLACMLANERLLECRSIHTRVTNIISMVETSYILILNQLLVPSRSRPRLTSQVLLILYLIRNLIRLLSHRNWLLCNSFLM